MRVGFNAKTLAIALGGLLALSGAASAAVYNDSTGEASTGTGAANLGFDILSTTITSDATNVTVAVKFAGPIVSFEKIDLAIYAPGSTTATVAPSSTSIEPFGRPFGLGSTTGVPGMNIWIDGFNNGGTSEGYGYLYYVGSGGANGAWGGYNNMATGTTGAGTDTKTFTIPWSVIGLSNGSTIYLDVYTADGASADGPFDSAGNPAQTFTNAGSGGFTNTGNQYFSNANILTFPPVPEPSSLALLGLGGLGLMRRRK